MASPPSKADPRGGEQNMGEDTKDTSRGRVKLVVATALGCLVLVAVIVTLCCTLLLPSGGGQDPGHPEEGGGSPDGGGSSDGGGSPGIPRTSGEEDDEGEPPLPVTRPGPGPGDYQRRGTRTEDSPTVEESTPRGTPHGIITLEELTPPPTAPTQMYSIPRYGRLVVMHGPPSKSQGGFTPLYDTAPAERFCTVVEGTGQLGISGRGTNGKMADLLAQLSKGRVHRGDVDKFTRAAHRGAIDRARGRPGALVAPVLPCPFYEKMCSYFKPYAGKHVEQSVATPILAILKDEYSVYGHSNNRCVLYVVPPKLPHADFEKAYAATYRNTLQLVQLYNQNVPLEDMKIRRVRFPYFSGGVYRNFRSAPDLGYTAARTMMEWMAANRPEFMLDLGYDPKNSLFFGMRRLASE